ncbi:PLP-dependent aminotransferase family protein [Burkholderia plantarii]|uniref:Transcriptional regulator, GntR family n=1 Tax=Burkholderia plantarii TaxID=41899 RepID=A0A0B6RV99_BURPL|nr:PLP-dependent aminotransferase family protein [Burkholderia plantarii]AJK46094.1 transcriptional regulator, GntR family [Burkholderia plantarii]WLE59056.1 PLP-dependent aminotransferase family protein [Burkholderia plantarii]
MHTKYRLLAEHYAKAIENGFLAEGERLPSLRELMALHHVSISTAVEACRVLEMQGYVEAKPRTGYFVRSRKPIKVPVPVQQESRMEAPAERIDPADYVGVHERISVTLARGQQRQPKIDLAGAVCAPSLYPGAALRDTMLRILRARPSLYDSGPETDGVRKLREAIARTSLTRGLHIDADTVLVTHGCSEALSLALRAVTGPGDIVAIESPCYFGILQIIESLGLRAIEIPTDPQTGISVSALEFAINHMGSIHAVVCMPSVQNPLGSVMSDAAKQRMVALCEKHHVAIIEDDTYGAFLPSPASTKPIKAWDQSGNVIYCNSFNKSLSPGSRVGWLIGGKWQNRIKMLMYAVSRHREEMSQLVVADFTSGGTFNRHMRRMNRLLKDQRAQVVDAVLRYFPAGTTVTQPGAGLLLWVTLPDELNTDRLFDKALDKGIRICPGSIFSNTNKFSNCLRLSAGMPFDAKIDAALKTLAQLSTET